MHARSLRTVLPLFLALASSVAAQQNGAAQKAPIPAPLGESVPALNRQSSWAQDSRFEGKATDKSLRGVYPVGNGYVFTYMGLGSRANTMMAVTGPSYAAAQKRLPEGHFGSLSLDLGGIALADQSVRRSTEGNFVITQDRSETGVSLRTLTFAAPGSRNILRVIVVHNGSRAAVDANLHLRASGKAKADGEQMVLRYDDRKHQYRAVVRIPGAEAQADGSLMLKLGELAAGDQKLHLMSVQTAAADAPLQPAPADAAAATKAAQESLAWWRKQTARTPKLNTQRAKVQDLFDDWKVLMLTMRDARSGVFTPMVSHRGAWIRENSGAILTMLRYNYWAEAKRTLSFFIEAMRKTGEMREYYPLDLDVSGLPAVEKNWKRIAIPESELASWFVLQVFWYYRASQDAAFVKEHKDLILHCLQRQKRGKNSLMRFSGHERFMGALNTIDLASLDRNPHTIAEAADLGRQSYSLRSGLLFLIAMNAYGELLDGIDRLNNPEKWKGDPQKIAKPSRDWLQRSHTIMLDVEKEFYVGKPGFPVIADPGKDLMIGDDWTGFFTPAISAVNGKPHLEPVANACLFPLWVGFTFPTGERSRHNLRNTITRLCADASKPAEGERHSTLLGTTKTLRHFTGDVPGMLLTGMVERDAKHRAWALEDMLAIAEPAGTWARLYDPEGRPCATDLPAWPERMSINESGINLDAFMFALNGVRHVNVPSFDNESIKLKLRLPKQTTALSMENIRKDGRAFSVWVRERYRRMTAEELKQNEAQQDKRYKKDPNKLHRTFEFKMTLLSDNPTWGRYQVDADVSGTMFVRYLHKGEDGDIEEDEFWEEDDGQFFPDGAELTSPPSFTLDKKEGAELLVLTNRNRCAEILGSDKTTLVDTGLPLTGRALVDLMLEDNKPVHPSLYLDLGYDAADARTQKRPQFWQSKNWKAALSRYQAAGGQILRPHFVSRYELREGEGFKPIAAREGRLELPQGPAKRMIRFQISAPKAMEVVLRIGSGCGYKLVQDGLELSSESSARRPVRDQDSVLVSLKQGVTTFEVELMANGPQIFFASCSDSAGLPIPGLK